MPVVFGLGSGRCGTKSLAYLLNLQSAAACFHEANPACMSWHGAEHTVLALLQNFWITLDGGRRAIALDYTSPHRDRPLQQYLYSESLDIVGDIGFYYLPYVEYIMEMDSNVRFPVLQRDRSETIKSFRKKLEVPQPIWRRKRLVDWIDRSLTGKQVYKSRNHWAPKNDNRWQRDSKWDKCFPTFEQKPHLEDAIAEWYDQYYNEVWRLEKKFPDNVKRFDMSQLNTPKGQESIITFCGGRSADIVFHKVHENVAD
jgi:hypothetical protein